MRMAPNVTGSPTALFLAEAQVISPPKPTPVIHKETPRQIKDRPQYHWHIVWRNVIAFVYLHTAALYGLYLCFTSAKLITVLWGVLFAMFASMGITAGAHRLWAHRAYKAKWPLRIYLAICQTIAFQNHIYEWVRDHRVHHKFTDTDADPHNSKRGFFFSHIGWLMVKKHKDVKNKGKTVDMSDMEKDWVVMWQKKLYPIILPIFCFILPTFVPCYFWGESLWNSWHTVAVLRYTLSLNFTWLVNSAAHIWGTKPYDRTISPAENLSVALLAVGEGWHNYHHVFPWDYKAAELGNYRFNLTTGFIDLCARFGLAYDLKKASSEMVKRRIMRTGDGTHSSLEHSENEVWGWNDIDMTEDDKKLVEILNPKNMKEKNC